MKTIEKQENPETNKEIVKDIEKSGVSEEKATQEEKLDEQETKKFEKESQKEEIKTVEKKSLKPKKTESKVMGNDLQISTKNAAAICRFIKGKKIENAIADLEKVLLHKKAIPMKGEIPHRRGIGISSGRFLDKTAKSFIVLLKSLAANSEANEINKPVISECIANIASRPYGRFGSIRKKRSHVTIIAKESSSVNSQTKEKNKLNKNKTKNTKWKKK